MLNQLIDVRIYHGDSASYVHTNVAGICPRCRKCHFVFKNVRGKTACIECAVKIEWEWDAINEVRT